VAATDNGLFGAATGTPRGSWEAGVFDYKDLAANYLGHGYTRHWHREARVPWLYNPKTRIMVSYDDSASLSRKAQFVRSRNLGGVMIWELSGDDNRRTLLNALHAGLSDTHEKQP
jgi:chitinase